MESHEEKLHKLVLQSKINETKDVMKRKASEIDKSKVYFRDLLWLLSLFFVCFPCVKSSIIEFLLCILQIEKGRGDKGGFGSMSIQSMGSGRLESSFSDMSISGGGGGGFGSGSGFGLSTDIDSFSSKSKGLFQFICMNCTRALPILMICG